MEDPLPLTWRPTWLYGALIRTLLRPQPPFARDGSNDPFWLAFKDVPLRHVMRDIRYCMRNLSSFESIDARVSYDLLMPHFIVASCLYEETIRLDWFTVVEDIAPHGMPLNRHAMQAYIKENTTAAAEWKFRLAEWFSRATAAPQVVISSDNPPLTTDKTRR